MISANNVTLRFGKKALFEDVNIKFTEGNCYGLIGANGAGKSTFLKILSGEIEPSKGDVTMNDGERLSVLQQDHYKYDEYQVLDTVIMGNKRLYEIMKEKDAIYMKEDFSDEDGVKAAELEAEFAEMNGWEAESDASTLLNGLGVGTEYHYSLMKDLDGGLKVKEKEMITNVVDFGDSIARDVMIPRADMTIASVDMAYDDLLKLYMEVPYTRIPVYEDSRDNVIGILHVKDLFFYKATHDINNFSVRNIMRKPLYVYEYQKTNDLLHSMKSDSNTMAIVLDEYGICIGLITIEDLIEEIIGDIKDEYDTEEHNNIIKVDDTHYNVDGSIKLDDLNDALNLKIESEDYDSLGGYITELLDHIPAKGESVTDISCIYKVLEMDKKRVARVLITLAPQEPGDADGE